MAGSSRTWLSSLLLFAGVLPLSAGELQIAGFEKPDGWQIVTRGSGLKAAFDNQTSQAGSKSFTVSIDSQSPTEKEDFAGIEQVLQLTRADKGISFYVKDTYTEGTAKYHWMELLLDGEVIWESDVAGGDTEWRKVSLDLTRYLKDGKLSLIHI